jgi:type IV pilus assembly protein PilA
LATLRAVLKYWPSRPFANAHWSLMVILLVLWELALTGQACREDPRYFEVVLATVTLCITFWAADLRKDPLANWWRVPRVLIFALYDICAFFLLFVFFAIPVMIFTPTYQCYTARAKFSEVILSASSNRATIAERAEKAKTLKGSGLGLIISPNKRVSGGLVSADGVIIVTSEDPPGFVVLRPRMENGVVQWSCGGLPIKIMPGSCREPPF